MCGRYVLSTWSDVVDLLGLELARPEWFVERFNVAPTQVEPVLLRRAEDTPLDAAPMRWGLVPHWAKDLKFGARCINARSETAHEKPSFREAFAKRRCLIPLTGFYEWRREGKTRLPFFVHDERGLPLLLAGLWARWRDRSGGEDAPHVESFSLLTRPAEGAIAEIHDRMPVGLEPDDARVWADPRPRETAELSDWLRSRPAAPLVLRPVSRAVNRVGTEGQELLEERPDHA